MFSQETQWISYKISMPLYLHLFYKAYYGLWFEAVQHKLSCRKVSLSQKSDISAVVRFPQRRGQDREAVTEGRSGTVRGPEEVTGDRQ